MRSTFLIIVLMVLLGGPSARGQECPYVNIWFVVDASGSISADEIDQARDIIRTFVVADTQKILDGTLWVGISVAGARSEIVSGFPGMMPDSLLSSLDNIQRRVWLTNLLSAITFATDQFDPGYDRFKNGRNVVFLLSDGVEGSSEERLNFVEETRKQLEARFSTMYYFTIDISIAQRNDTYEGQPYERESNTDVLRVYSTPTDSTDGWLDYYDWQSDDGPNALGEAFRVLTSCK